MKKPTQRARKWNRIHSRETNRRRLASKAKVATARRHQTLNHRQQPRLGTAKVSTGVTVTCPNDFSLESNFLGVVNLLQQIRTQSKRRRNESVYINFREIQQLSPTAALVLVAELDRWNHFPLQKKLRTTDVEQWNIEVRRQLADMGFFDLLDAINPTTGENTRDAETRYVKFRTGTKADGEAIHSLREQDLEPVAGKIPRKQHLYAAVTEAMTNVVHHAYEDGNIRPNWWLSASHNATNGQVTIIIYDQGMGIPNTLRRKFRELILQLGPLDHARMIRAAHDLTRTATGQAHRGHGLQRDIRGYLNDLNCEAYYKVTSLEGEYSYERTLDGQEKHIVKSNPRPLNGTLIEWRLTLP